MHIFGDEAGFTGNKLRDAEQDVFAYATVAIHPDAAQELVARVKKDHRIQGNELKGSTLLKQERGKYAIADILKASQTVAAFTVGCGGGGNGGSKTTPVSPTRAVTSSAVVNLTVQ